MKTETLFAVILMMLTAMTVAPEAFAQDVFTLEEVTVTATKRETALEDTPMALSVVTGDMINEQGRNDIMDVLKDIPGLMLNTAGGGNAWFNIRVI